MASTKKIRPSQSSTAGGLPPVNRSRVRVIAEGVRTEGVSTKSSPAETAVSADMDTAIPQIDGLDDEHCAGCLLLAWTRPYMVEIGIRYTDTEDQALIAGTCSTTLWEVALFHSSGYSLRVRSTLVFLEIAQLNTAHFTEYQLLLYKVQRLPQWWIGWDRYLQYSAEGCQPIRHECFSYICSTPYFLRFRPVLLGAHPYISRSGGSGRLPSAGDP